jgi:D-tyrosyl-tRNA(Tyr) deacylase
MRLLVQRVSRAEVKVADSCVGSIASGLLVLVGVGLADTVADADYLAQKTALLRVFEDASGRMNRALGDVDGSVLAVSQFTLYGACEKGNRPSFAAAADAELGRALYERYVEALRHLGVRVETGVFGADMQVELVNEGPVTLALESTGRVS